MHCFTCFATGDPTKVKALLLEIFCNKDLGIGGNKIRGALDAFPWDVYDPRMLVNLLNSTLRSTLQSVTRGDKDEYDKVHANHGKTGETKV